MTIVFFEDELAPYLKLLKGFPRLDRDEELELACRAQDGDAEAVNLLIHSHLSFVVKLARRLEYPTISLLDLVQEGNIGLLRSVEKFEPKRGLRFSTYARWWIRSFMLKYISQNLGALNLGRGNKPREILFALGRVRKKIEQGGEKATAERLAEHFGCDVGMILLLSRQTKGRNPTIDSPIGESGGVRWAEVGALVDSSPTPEAKMSDQQSRQWFKTLCVAFEEMLNERDLAIWKDRVMSEEPLILKALAERFGVSRERIRQVEVELKKKAFAFFKEPLIDER